MPNSKECNIPFFLHRDQLAHKQPQARGLVHCTHLPHSRPPAEAPDAVCAACLALLLAVAQRSLGQNGQH